MVNLDNVTEIHDLTSKNGKNVYEYQWHELDVGDVFLWWDFYTPIAEQGITTHFILCVKLDFDSWGEYVKVGDFWFKYGVGKGATIIQLMETNNMFNTYV